MALETVRVPEPMIPLFEKAETYVKEYFSTYRSEPKKGTITIGDERYILLRAKPLRVGFVKYFSEYLGLSGKMGEQAANNFLYILAQSIGREDAKHFVQTQKVTDPIAKLAAGPIHFSFSGWAFVDIFPESKPSPDDNYFLLYDHPYSFEAEAYLQDYETAAENPVCVMNAGYSSGWCSESFGVNVEAREIMCKAKGDRACRFVMSVKNKLEYYEKWALENIKK